MFITPITIEITIKGILLIKNLRDNFFCIKISKQIKAIGNITTDDLLKQPKLK